MKNRFINALVLSIILFASVDLYAVSSRRNYFSKPQVGIWYGPITPIGETGEYVDTNLGGGLFFRYNLPYDPLKIGLETAYQKYESDSVYSLRLVPVYLNFVYLLPFDLPVKIQLKGGGGLCHVKMNPDNTSQWDPVFMTGVEVSFPAGKLANIALRIDYLQVYERYLENATEDGYFINAGISLYFNLNL